MAMQQHLFRCMIYLTCLVRFIEGAAGRQRYGTHQPNVKISHAANFKIDIPAISNLPQGHLAAAA